MADLKPSDIDQLTNISEAVGQQISDTITFVESQIQQLVFALTNIAPLPVINVGIPNLDITQSIVLDDVPQVSFLGNTGITKQEPTVPTGLVDESDLAEPVDPASFSPLPQTVLFPEAPNFEETISLNDIPDAPTLTDPGAIPAPPSITLPTAPIAPDVNQIPELPSVGDIVVPEIPSLNLPGFGETLPIFDVALPEFKFEFVEQPYTSVLLDATTARLLNDVINGGTGLGAVIEQEIYDRGTERDQRNIVTEITTLKNQLSVTGFELPFGTLNEVVQDVVSKHDDKKADLSREIVVEQARLALNNTQFSVQQSISLEGVLISHANQVAERTFQAARSTAEFQISFLNAEIAFFNLRLNRYSTAANVHFEQLRVETVKLDLYRAQLDGVNAEIAVDQLKLAEFRERFNKLNAEVQVFNAQVEVFKASIDVNRSVISLFEAQIDGFNAVINHNRNQIELHNAQLRTNATEFERIRAKIAIHDAKLNTIQVNSSNRIQELNALIDHQKNQLAAASSEINKYQALAGRVTSRENTLNALFGTKISNFGAKVDAEKSEIAFIQDNLKLKLERAVKDMDRIIEITRMNIDKNFKEWDFRTVVAQSALAAKQFILEAGARSEDQTVTTL